MVWRRLPLIRTSVSLGFSPRRAACTVRAAVSPPPAWTFSEGTDEARALARSGEPVLVRASLPTSSIGAALSSAFIPVTRVPVTMTADTSVAAPAAPSASAAKADVASSAAASARVDTPVNLAIKTPIVSKNETPDSFQPRVALDVMPSVLRLHVQCRSDEKTDVWPISPIYLNKQIDELSFW